MVTFLLLLLLLKAPSGVGNGERVSPSQLTTGSREHRERPPPSQRGPGRSSGRKRFWCFLGAPERLSLQYLSQILHYYHKAWGLRLNHHQFGCRPSLSAPWLMLSYVRHSLTLKRYSRHFYVPFTLLPKQSNRQGGARAVKLPARSFDLQPGHLTWRALV